MGKRGKKPAGALKALDIKPVERVQAPADMSARDAKLFRAIVAGMPAEHFRPQDVPLLREYCEAAGRGRDAQEIIDTLGLLVPGAKGGMKANPAIAIRTAAAGVLAQLAVKLRLCPSARAAGGSRPRVGEVPRVLNNPRRKMFDPED